MKSISKRIGFVLSLLSLSGNPVAYARFLSVYVWLVVKRRVFGSSHLAKPMCIYLSYKGTVFPFFIQQQADFDVLYTTFINEEYSIVDVQEPVRTIVDLGSNIGTTVVYFHIMYPDARIVSVEADPRNIDQLRLNCAWFADHITILPVAVSARDDDLVTFYQNPFLHCSSSLARRTKDDIPIQVKTMSLDSILQNQSITTLDILKFDVEGAEYEVFESFQAGLTRVRCGIGEIHTAEKGRTVESFLELLPGTQPHVENGLVVFYNKNIERI